MPAGRNPDTMTAHLFRENSGKMVAVLTRTFGLRQIDSIMDVVQDTFETALVRWRYSGPPDNPEGWLMQVARNKAINTLKRESRTTGLNEAEFAEETAPEQDMERLFSPAGTEDSQLRLLLACCRPSFSEKNQIIITLYALCGFGVREIANALLMSEEAVKKALFRTKAEFREKGDPLHKPFTLTDPRRIRTILSILYLMFNEGYKATRSGELINNDLCYEAIRLAKLLLKDEIPIRHESHALLALMFFNLSRFPARLSSEGEIISLEDQDRKQWDRVFIEEGCYYLSKATEGDSLSRYHLEAMISSLHCIAGSYEKTDWETIVYLYRQLELIAPSPMASLSRIIAESHLGRSLESLEQIEKLKEGTAPGKQYLLYAAKGNILKRRGERQSAQEAFEQAMKLAGSALDRKFLENQIRKCQN